MDVKIFKQKYCFDTSLASLERAASKSKGRERTIAKGRLQRASSFENRAKAESRSKNNSERSDDYYNLRGLYTYFKAILQQTPALISNDKSAHKSIFALVDQIQKIAKDGMNRTEYAQKAQVNMNRKNLIEAMNAGM